MAGSALDRAREHWANGRTKSALAAGWDAANDAVICGDRETVEAIEFLAEAIVTASEGRQAEDAQRLASYCRLSLAGVGSGVQATSVLGRMFGRTRKRRCPDCAEKISVEAKVCPHCGFRLAPPPTD